MAAPWSPTPAAPRRRRVAIVGAGVSGLAACKHLLERGLDPVVFEATGDVGGVWNHCYASTRLQTPRTAYQFTDHPWPAAITSDFPRHDEVAEYCRAYAARFGILDRVRFNTKVVSVDYVGAGEEDMWKWTEWGGSGEAFGAGAGEWHLAVEPGGVYKADFVVLCLGLFSGVADMPSFPPGKGPEAFAGVALHAMDYADMGAAAAEDLVRGKRVAIIGGKKSAVDIATEIAELNGVENPCTVLYRTKRWIIPGRIGGLQVIFLLLTRLSEFAGHKPGEGPLLWLLAVLLLALRRVIYKLVEAFYQRVVPMRKNGMTPDCGRLLDAAVSCNVAMLPETYYDRVEDGSIVLKKAESALSFCKEGVVIGEGEVVKSDVVILATGFRGELKLKSIFGSAYFREIAISAPLYRECIHPRIPQLAIIGFTESTSTIYTSELRSIWLAHFLAGGMRLPSIAAMEEDGVRRVKFAGAAGSGGGRGEEGGRRRRPCLVPNTVWFNDALCRDMGCEPRRKRGWRKELFEPYLPADYAGLGKEAAAAAGEDDEARK